MSIPQINGGYIRQEAKEIQNSWDTIAEGFDEFVTPYSMSWGENALRHINIRPGMTILDVAAGSGAVSIPAARMGAKVTAVDISPIMIERLKTRSGKDGLLNIKGYIMDGQALSFPDNEFDVSASLNGISLFPDLSKGLSEVVRVTKTGGQVVIVAFGSPQNAEWLILFMTALQSCIPGFTGIPMDPPPLPFQLSEPDKFYKKMARAGLKDIRIETVTFEMECRTAKQLWDVVTNSNPIGATVVEGLNQEEKTKAQNVLEDMLGDYAGNSSGFVLQTDINIGIGIK